MDHGIEICLTLYEVTKLFSKGGFTNLFPSLLYENSSHSSSLPTFCIIDLLSFKWVLYSFKKKNNFFSSFNNKIRDFFKRLAHISWIKALLVFVSKLSFMPFYDYNLEAPLKKLMTVEPEYNKCLHLHIYPRKQIFFFPIDFILTVDMIH